ncbi:MAG: PSD1 and planctomycete cytochrome C domain-containing protein [Acidobacteria bacterium]|nr:PSD1 and planctomycete cytochrome C domain-containing protein [Acidobacteriota bacterium]
MKRNVNRTPKFLCILALVLLGLGTLPIAHPSAQEAQPSEMQVEKKVFSILKLKCLQCHGEAVQMSNLDLRTRESMLKGGDNGPAIVPGDAIASRLYRRVVGLEKPAMPMAPIPPLTSQEIAALKSWIDQGAKLSNTDTVAATSKGYGKGYKEIVFTAEDRKWWSFQKPVRHPIPIPSGSRGRANPTNPIDAFILNSLYREGLAPAPQADRNTLIRRAYLDLTGLLPAPEEVDKFVKDSSPKAYENLIERLLSSPHYGERWGRFWLDVARYADSSGYEHDYDIASAWRYRDYVIKAFNQDKPYNRFIVEQLAGDELDDRDFDSLIATTYYRIGPRVRYREKDNPYYRYEYLDDMIRTTFQGFMGLSVNCARCHDHKFDPISRMDYYRTMAMIFGNVDYNHPLAPPEKIAEYERTRKEVEEQVRPLWRKVAEIESPYRKAQFEKRLAKFPEEIQIAVRTPEEKRTPGQKLLAAQIVSLDIDPDAFANQNLTASSYRGTKMSEADEMVRQKLLDRIQELQKRQPPLLPIAEGVRDGDYRLIPDGPGDEPLPGKGHRFDYGVECCFLPQPGKQYQAPPVYFGSNGVDVADDQKSLIVEPGYLQVLISGTSPPPIAHPPESGGSSGRRRALAEWIASPDNPLTARVMVNRIWHWHFGHGIVRTPSNFGKMGVKPSHPELLDWLATEFINQGWSIKHIHRLIMNSQTYKMASSFSSAANLEKDPNNVYLWRFPLRRLEAEAIRDIILSASGNINLQAGGEPFFPAIPPAVRDSYRQGKWVLTKENSSNWRRGIYAYLKRGLKYPMFEVHDQPDPNVTCESRNVTTVPTQALTMLNNEFVLIQARSFAERVLRDAGGDPVRQVQLLYRIALSREPALKELERGQAFILRQRDYHHGRQSNTNLAALTDLAHVVLNTNEFVYIN